MQHRSVLTSHQQRLERAIQYVLTNQKNKLSQRQRLLDSLSPANTLSRGYAIVRDDEGRVLKQARGSREGADLAIELAEGALGARVTTLNE